MNSLIRDIYFMHHAEQLKPSQQAKVYARMYNFVSSNRGFDFMSKYYIKQSTHLYGLYLKEKTKRTLEKTNGTGVLLS